MKFKRLLFCIFFASVSMLVKAQIGPDALIRLDLLPQIKSQIHTGLFSSYDRTEGNDDGFSGKYSFLRKEGDDLVIAEMEGPGAIYRIHSPGPQDGIMEFYFDGEKTPRISMKFTEMLDGKHSPFLAPLVGSGVGGNYIYVPLTYQVSCKVIYKAEKLRFYDINYVTYPKNTVVKTFQNPPPAEWLQKIGKISKMIEASGTDISSYLVSEGSKIETVKTTKVVTPGQTTELFKINKPGRIVGLKLGPAKLFAGKERDIVLNIYWDNDKKPAVSCPVGDFFGYSFGDPATRSLFIGTSGEMNYVYLPMPFSQSARIELVSESSNTRPGQIQAEIEFTDEGKRPDEGHLYTYWHRENPCTTGKPFTYLNTEGKGHVVGVFIQAQGKNPGNTYFFEGDDIVTLDGKMTIHGTGSEDSFNGGWYDVPARWEERASFPFSGCLDYKKPIGRTGGYRWLISDAYVFKKSIDFTIEHGAEGNKDSTDYTSVTYFYSSVRPSADLSLPDVKSRQIADPAKVIFVPGWNVPIHSSPLDNAVIEKKNEKIGENGYRYFSMETKDQDVFGPHQVSFIFDMPAAGKYQVSIKAIKDSNQGIIQMFQHDSPLGEQVDLYADIPVLSNPENMGFVDMTEGNNVVYFRLTGKNPNSKGVNMKLVEVIFERIR